MIRDRLKEGNIFFKTFPIIITQYIRVIKNLFMFLAKLYKTSKSEAF